MCGNDLIAVGVLQAARALKLSVPDDVAVSGFDDRSWAATTAPPLSTAKMPLQQLGAEAARLLFALIEDERVLRRHVILPTQVVLRGTTPRGSGERPSSTPADMAAESLDSIGTIQGVRRTEGAPDLVPSWARATHG